MPRVITEVSRRRIGGEQRVDPVCVAVVDELEDRVHVPPSTDERLLVSLTNYVKPAPRSRRPDALGRDSSPPSRPRG